VARIDVIRKIVEASPNDPFARYGLAMELANLGQLAEADAAFVELEQRSPDYAPQYLMHFNLLVKMDRKPEARALGARGVEALRKKGDGHALGELESALQNLPHDDD
jgi:tetratricopeptide (TPR) repeat protein